MRIWHRFWVRFHRRRAEACAKRLDDAYRQRRLSSTKQRVGEDRIREEHYKADYHKARAGLGA